MDHNEHRVEPTLATTVRHLPIEFTGSGSEYFRIWIINLLLLVVTLGLYWPWAKVRRLRYFWGNTLVDGDPLGFHGNPRQMFKGWMLVGVLFGLYNWASNFSPVAGVLAFVLLAALWPALWRSSMIFRMANTSWRGLRFRFLGSARDAYFAHLPPFLALLPVVLLGLARPEESKQAEPAWIIAVALVSSVLFVFSLPWLLWRVKAYQHRHYAIGPLQTDFRASVGSFYRLAFKPFLLLVGVAALFALAAALIVTQTVDVPVTQRGALLMLLPTLIVGFWLMFFLGISPWLTTRLQNLVWTKTGNSQMRFISELSFRRMFMLSIKNGLLIAVTLGLYWPFARVAVARLRLQAVHIRSIADLQALLAVASDHAETAAGDAAGDFFGLDVGL